MSVVGFSGGPAEPSFERTPPNNIEAEQSVLGGMLLSKDAIADVVEVLRADDFYRPAHQIIYEIITDLYGRGDPADAVTVFDELQRRGDVGKVGGGAYLHTLTVVVPTAANAGYYAKIVREQAVLRRLIEAGTRIVSYGYGGNNEEVDDLVDRAQAEIYKVTERRTSEDYLPLSEIMPAALDEIEAIGSRGGQMVGVPTGFQDLDALTNGLHPGQMIVVAARPAIGKSTLGLDFARSAAIKHGLTTVIFSLEMSRNEITMRLLSAEARVALHTMRSGMMSDDDWTRMARRMGEVAEAPLFIDDSPNMSMMEIRAKCRRLKQRHDLRFVIVDYLQLMSSPKKTESRQQEVSELSRALKLLAKELEVPVIAISQLNRGPEQRTDKRPAVSDLRESGCLTAGTRVLRADTGAEVALGELLASGVRDIPVWSLDERLKLVPRRMTHVFPSGVKPVYRVLLGSGREVEATANHPFLTYEGWCPAGDLLPGTRVGVARHVPPPLNLTDVDVSPEFIRGSVPRGMFSVPKARIAAFLRDLWTTSGEIRWDPELGEARISYRSQSRRVVDDLARLLLRFNVMTRVEDHRLTVLGRENQLRFLEDVADQADGECAAALRRDAPVAIPGPVWDRVRDVLGEPEAREQGRLGQVVQVLDRADVEVVATNDVFWDEVVAVEPLGEQSVYDATVPGTHNFVANGIAVHNSIEQDADMVILLHREDAYERESPRAGEADLIVAKHRNGPTATVTVAFQGHYSRFVDMAQH
ncbi:replicative DNA helicase [Acrocarpospora catenulata]|uniref:replicative DNA helicase n=1 Tax=Acrocarpospora catenulata TaxID=2836182 RepID=UPI001BD95C50|nr:replicative DNA helicase [Acrocarpospora catenulata]